ncbi:helix-turn-helix transcriptional regulator [Corynebacterium sp. CCM 8863]|uniref:Helix-turn-helix transcriptional regulator n=2 Tax=Corynebacterium meridianum TaxID=2765363 RepID=A0A934MBL8_9CORY|nr:helix-turn-helix transcriptional regulator [Corynebacterium meridianum]
MQLAFARELSCARKERKITQTELAEVSGVDQAEISRIENGRANPTLYTVSRLAAALGKEIRLSPAGG